MMRERPNMMYNIINRLPMTIIHFMGVGLQLCSVSVVGWVEQES